MSDELLGVLMGLNEKENPSLMSSWGGAAGAATTLTATHLVAGADAILVEYRRRAEQNDRLQQHCDD